MGKKSGVREKKRKASGGPIGGEAAHMAFIYWSEQESRFELKIDNILKGYTSGEEDPEHVEGKAILSKMAEDKGYTVIES